MAINNSIKYNDLGLGNKTTPGNYRALNKDGSFNVIKANISLLGRLNVYHWLVNMSWTRFFTMVFVAYLLVNFLFGYLYYIIGVEHLSGIRANTKLEEFKEAFFFSSQTITTLGYGRVAPVGTLTSIVTAFQSLLGLLSFALATGLLYGRFSKPTARIRYSKNGLIAPYEDINAFMFRVINPQYNHLLELEVTVTLSARKLESELRDFFLLELERSNVVFLPTVWTIVHPIDKNSPLYGLSKEQVLRQDIEIIIMIKAFDESFSQIVYSKASYHGSELKWGEQFASMMTQTNKGIVVDVARLDATNPAVLNDLKQ